MGKISVAAYRPRAGMEADLLAVLTDRLPLLRRLGLATDRPAVHMRSREGVLIEISEWVDDAAIDRAHHTPEVLALWDRFAACCTFVRLDALAEAHEDFATFAAIE